MSRCIASLTLSNAALSFLEEGLTAITRSSNRGHERGVGRMAVTARPCLRARDLPPGSPIPFDAWRLLTLTLGRRSGRRDRRKLVRMTVYRPTIDLPGTGRITLARERVVDVTEHGNSGASRAPIGPADARAAVLLHQAVVDAAPHHLSTTFNLPAAHFLYAADRPPVLESTFPGPDWHAARVAVEGRIGYPAWMLTRPSGKRWDVHPVDGSACPFAGGEAVEGSTRDGWIVRDGRPTPMAQKPDRVVIHLGDSHAVAVRNPAFAALRRHGLIAPEWGYRAWIDRVARPSPAGSVVRDPDDPKTRAGQFRQALADYALSDLDRLGRSARLEALLGDMRAACEAVGLAVPSESAAAHDALLGWMASPWEPVILAEVPLISVVDLDAPGLPSSLKFTNGYAELDLTDIRADPHAEDEAPPLPRRRRARGPRRRSATWMG